MKRSPIETLEYLHILQNDHRDLKLKLTDQEDRLTIQIANIRDTERRITRTADAIKNLLKKQ